MDGEGLALGARQIEILRQDRDLSDAQATLHRLSTELEACGYSMAGQVDSVQVARVLALSHELMAMAARLRAADVRGHALDCGHYMPEELPLEITAEIARFFG